MRVEVETSASKTTTFSFFSPNFTRARPKASLIEAKLSIVIRAAEETGAIVTAEEHSVIGGLAGAVAEVIAENKPIPMERIGIKDTFTESGQYNDLLEKYGMGIKHIIDAAKKVIKRKK
ncbi:unnamed protein product [marine sediment metagenome]|uniref:Transketolase C-terminal domain-containing protein n=1 Tax=marine sediment metagenome TaxID=412755 RepID=X1CE35_9ZZZZ